MALVGYARVSSVGQILEVQLDKLQQCRKIFQEKKTAAGGKRPQLAACLEYVRERDNLVITRLDQLARSTLHLCHIADELKRKEVERFLTKTSTPATRRAGCCSICWGQLISLRRKSAPSGKRTGLPKRKQKASGLGRTGN